jgi:hypothetical protein
MLNLKKKSIVTNLIIQIKTIFIEQYIKI